MYAKNAWNKYKDSLTQALSVLLEDKNVLYPSLKSITSLY
mgnify:CR=1 FL=1